MIGSDAVAAAAAAGQARGGRSRPLQRLRPLRRGLPLRGDPHGAAHRRPAVPDRRRRSIRRSASPAASASVPARRRRRSGAPRSCKTGIDLPDFPLKELRERVIAARSGSVRGRARSGAWPASTAAAGRLGRHRGQLPCVAMAPPSLIDFILSRDLADGVVVAGCAESACYQPAWHAVDRAALCAQSAIPICARAFRASGCDDLGIGAGRAGRFETELADFQGALVGALRPMQRHARPSDRVVARCCVEAVSMKEEVEP